MKVSQTLLILSCLLGVRGGMLHKDVHVVGCSDTRGEDVYTLDGEEMWYADFVKKEGVEPQPPFIDHMTYQEGAYEQAVANQGICRQNLKVAQQAYKNPPLKLDEPHSTVYTKDVVEIGKENHLICHVTGFYPAPVQVYWTRNNQNVTGGISLNTPFPNSDGTFNQFSILTFTPELGDIYSCSVEHRALSQSLTRVWEVEQNQPGIGPSVFCGLGLTVGLLGVAIGTFFLIKGNECN
ncbi:H-2 class II histocompatibility antigen, A-U alpha chain-like [Lampris incognitus]|uniref:H-2 class II histocompatibility antigen, A-U alpha chain-like n=1 Tax=Lampris incognitus TaxID=2546036 RepID=UPI0024B4AB4F|nr:H-2 class II histocompatibility antigen, A-U alpha chain-like [Lampris incognitus]XP_056156636.1 H-2 class II histocompatibility antigen, A-U alpha chain-like [Lampris incognitus]